MSSLLFEPQLVNGAAGDPGLYLDFRDQRRALLFDLGDIAALPPRKLMRLSHIFVTHAHMDHFSGFDHLLRVVLGRKPRIVLFGGPDFIAKVEHKLSAYVWNVVHRYDIEMVIEACAIGIDGRGQRASFSSRNGFVRGELMQCEWVGDVVHEEAMFRVRARFVDHGIPCLAYAIEEKAHLAQVKVAKDRLAQLGLSAGPWLRELKQAILSGAPSETPIVLQWRDRSGEQAMTRTLGELRDLLIELVPGKRIGYVTDLRYTEANLETLGQLLSHVDTLFIESVFLDQDADHAAKKNHLTARQAGWIARRIGAKAVVPFHFSPRYEHREAALIAELQAAWLGGQAA